MRCSRFNALVLVAATVSSVAVAQVTAEAFSEAKVQVTSPFALVHRADYEYGNTTSTGQSGNEWLTYGESNFRSSTFFMKSYTRATAGGAFGVGSTFKGFAYFFSITNTSAVDATISFTFDISQWRTLSWTNPWESGLTRSYAGVESYFDSTPLTLDDYRWNTREYNGYMGSGSYDVNQDLWTKNMLLPAGETRVYEVWASSFSQANSQPVPEPTTLAALGFAALVARRRRR